MGDEERPLEIRMDPRDALSALVVWKGQPLGALRDIRVTINEETAHVHIVRAIAPRDERAWNEMRAAGIEVEDE